MGLPPKGRKRLSLDRISTLPQYIIENILCLMPIQDAARTSILSRGWRYNWTNIPRLEFNADTFQVSVEDRYGLSVLEEMYDTESERRDMTRRCKIFYAIYQVWIMHQGPIHDFTLSIEADETCIEIDQAIFHLSKSNTVKRFTLDVRMCWNYTVPLSFFSLHQLTHIDLRKCCLYEYARLKTSNAFPKLTSLHLEDVKTSLNMIRCLISDSTLLKSFTLIHRNNGYKGDPLHDLTIFDLFEFLPVIEHLTISVIPIKFYARSEAVPCELPTSLVHLKYICLEGMCFNSKYGLPFLALLIRSSPNLKKLKIVMAPKHGKIDSVALEDHDYTDIRLEHLNELEIIYFGNKKPELEFVKFILAKSPALKKVSIWLEHYVDVNKVLLQSLRASPKADINVDRLPIKIRRSLGSVMQCC